MKKNLNTRIKKAQLSAFIILAIILVAVVVAFFMLRGKLFEPQIPAEMEPVYSYYLSCIDQETANGASILGEQGGYINLPDFSPGSDYMPFSSQLNFLGMGVPYWYYVSGNGIFEEQIPSKEKMQEELNIYVEENLADCDFSSFEKQGFEVYFNKPSVETTIKDNSILVDVNQDLLIKKEDSSWRSLKHSTFVQSSLGRFYDLAKKIYLNNKQTMFLENYGLDILRLNAPVDGSEIGCSPKIWSINNIRNDLITALEANIPAIKLKGDYYSKSDPYFVRDIGESVDAEVNFMYSPSWPAKIDVWPNPEDNLLIAEPIGLQEGLGMLGFCYTPYHFVYDFAFPVMVQLYSGAEMFQFPVVVSIDKNKPRQALDASSMPAVVPTLCEHKNTRVSVSTYNTNLDPVNAEIKFKCFDTVCSIGKTQTNNEEAVLLAEFPQCQNGYVIASAPGYKTEKYMLSTIQENSAIILLNKEYNLTIEVQENGGLIASSKYSVITFTKGEEIKTVSYPDMKDIELTEGEYEIRAYVYTNSNIQLAGSQSQKCVEVPKSGVIGFFGGTEEKCFNFEIPSQIVSFAVSGGGTQGYYISESELAGSKKIIIDATSFGTPAKVEDLQLNYNRVESDGLNILFE
jgi:hypothetical protein